MYAVPTILSHDLEPVMILDFSGLCWQQFNHISLCISDQVTPNTYENFVMDAQESRA